MGEVLLPPSHPIEAVDSVFVVAHDDSTNGGAAKDLSVSLQGLMPDKPVVFVHTKGTDVDSNRELLLDYMQNQYDRGYSNQLVVSGGGDGTQHYTGDALLHPGTPSYLARALFTPWGLGYKNDGFHSLHERRLSRLPLALFHHPEGHVVTSNPLSVTMLTTENDTPRHEWAQVYATFGVSVPGAALLTGKAHRGYREQFPHWMHTPVDISRAAGAVLKDVVSVETLPTRGEASRIITELEFINGERMGGNGNFTRYTHLGDRAMFHGEINSDRPAAIIAFTGRAVLGRAPGRRVSRTVTVNFKAGGLPGQTDGEAIRDADGSLSTITSLTVGPAPEGKTLHYYATKAS